MKNKQELIKKESNQQVNQQEENKQEENKQENQYNNIIEYKKNYIINVINQNGKGKYYISTNFSDTYISNTSENRKCFSSTISSNLRPYNIIYIPKGLKNLISKEISKKKLKTINSEYEISKELIFIFIAQLISTYYYLLDDKNINKGKRLCSRTLQNMFQPYAKYKNIIDLLVEFKIIEINHEYSPTKKCKTYFICDEILKKGIQKIELKNEISIKILKNKYESILDKNNPIIQNLLEIYPKLKLPTELEIKSKANELIKNNYKNSKGKKLIFHGNNKKRYDDAKKEYTYVETAIKRFKFLTEPGLLLPSVASSEFSGHRICDSFTLMNSWIRDMIKIVDDSSQKEHSLVSLDFKCLHPNLAACLYRCSFSGSGTNISHEKIANELGIDKRIIKTEHLSFFNLPLKKCKIDDRSFLGMEDSILYDWYKKNEPTMLKNIIEEKTKGDLKKSYKNTTKKLFTLEVELMTKIIKTLNIEYKIYCLYVYDCIYVKESDKQIATKVMNDIAKQMSINTYVS